MEVVITSHDSERPNFSENTDLSEILFIARRLAPGEKAGVTHYVNLWRDPRSIHEALDHASRITAEILAIDGRAGQARILPSPAGVLGEITSLPAPQANENWTGAIFAQSYLMQAHWALDIKHELRLPGETRSAPLDLCRLDELGTLGYDVRDIFDAFSIDTTGASWTPYPAFWNHDAKKVVTIARNRSPLLIARTEAIAGRHLKARCLWSKSGRILLVSRLRTNTHRVIADRASQKGALKHLVGN